MADPREPLGRIFHEQGRLTVNAEREKPFSVESWDLRTPEQREIDMRGGHAVANYALAENAATWGVSCASCAAHLDRAGAERERAERAEARLAAVRDACRSIPTPIAERILAITGTGGTQDRSDEKEGDHG